MKKLSGLLAVSLVAFMMAPAARADIASTGYVNKNMEAKANKKIASAQLDRNDDTGYPTVAAAFSIANIALGDQAVIKQQGTTSANKALITNAKGTVETGLITKDMIADKAVTTGKIADANVTEGKLAKDSVTPLKVKDGLIKSGTNVTVSRDETTGVVTISSADTKYTLPTATDKVLGGVKVDTAMSDTSTNPVQNKVANAAIAAAATAAAAAQTKADNALPKTTYDSQVGTVSSANMGTTATTVVGAIKEIKSAVSATDGATVKTDQGTANKDKAVITNSTGKVTTGQIANGMIATGAVDADKIAASAVTSAKIADGTIVNADISDSAAIAQSKISGLTDALAAKFVAPGTSVTSKDGTYTLTMKVADGKPTYAWEEIGR